LLSYITWNYKPRGHRAGGDRGRDGGSKFYGIEGGPKMAVALVVVVVLVVVVLVVVVVVVVVVLAAVVVDDNNFKRTGVDSIGNNNG
jgi:Flp pilus assembly protein TadB